MEFLKQNKWACLWALFGLLVTGFISYIVQHISKNDFNTALLQFGSILIPLFAAIIIMLQNNEQIDKSTRTQLEHLQKLNDREIEEMQKLFQKQIDTLTDSTQKQIETLQENTNRQITSYSEQTGKIVDELADNSVLLGEILKREIEKAILQTDQQIEQAEKKLKEANDFILLRTDEERKSQIIQSAKVVEWLKAKRSRLYNKFKELMEIFKEN